MASGPILLVILLAAIAFIIYSTAKLKLNPFLALLLTAYGVGFAAGMPATEIVSTITNGFGGLMTSIGLVIILGTIIGVFLEKSGAAIVMADSILKVVGEKRPALAMNLIGYIVSIPVFCDSGFVILSSLNKALSKRTGVSLTALAVALSTGLYATHVLVPPTPGPLAAAGNLGLTNLGLAIMVGLLVAIPTSLAGLFWANRFAKDGKTDKSSPEAALRAWEEMKAQYGRLPGVWAAYAPIVVPIALIALSSVADFPSHPFGEGAVKTVLNFLGTPVTALLIGVFCCLFLVEKIDEKVLNDWIGASLKDAATILIVTGAGGALGKILSTTPIGSYLGETLSTWNLGIFLPFVIAAALKTAQGSSTVALVTTSAIIAPMLPALGFDSEMGRVLMVMAIGAGSMVVSHANDSFFWVVSQFSDMDVATAYRAQTIGTAVTGVVAIVTTALLSLVLL
ncbi:MAG: gluconate transporter [Symbiobacterium thermophilum]|uniref:GntP family permease n=2 Tax=Symbiobacterium thermophilum TaxID=2734 RepID=Q67LH2_SYMTH|nr:GntP family permease [Symbiobacterium thermophilum]OTA41864.1 MAG: gluconate transporter [Symbiobacterium thermophilum]BAD41474.1 GntP family permease [Symbiobacterium thermophilum IAM 14863]